MKLTKQFSFSDSVTYCSSALVPFTRAASLSMGGHENPELSSGGMAPIMAEPG